MGYPMAVNLRGKMDATATLYICDANEDAVKRFIKDQSDKGPIEVVTTGAEAVAKAVSLGLVNDWQLGLTDGPRCRISSLPCCQVVRKSSLFF